MGTTSDGSRDSEQPNVAQRLRQRLNEAKALGFEVRSELFDGESANWCILGGKKVLFLDLAASTSEQLQQIEDALQDYSLQRAA